LRVQRVKGNRRALADFVGPDSPRVAAIHIVTSRGQQGPTAPRASPDPPTAPTDEYEKAFNAELEGFAEQYNKRRAFTRVA
jgi:hypothetical protein